MGVCNEAIRRFIRPFYTILTVLGMTTSIFLLSLTMLTLPLDTAYTIWTGIGAVGSFITGRYFLGEPATPMRILATVVIVAGFVMLKMAS